MFLAQVVDKAGVYAPKSLIEHKGPVSMGTTDVEKAAQFETEEACQTFCTAAEKDAVRSGLSVRYAPVEYTPPVEE